MVRVVLGGIVENQQVTHPNIVSRNLGQVVESATVQILRTKALLESSKRLLQQGYKERKTDQRNVVVVNG